MIFRLLGVERSYGNKVRWLVTLSSGVAALVLAAGLLSLSYRDLRRSTEQGLVALGRLIASNASAPLEFGDRVYGAEALSALQAVPNVGGATLHDADGREFARYARTTEPPGDIGLAGPGLTQRGRWLVYAMPIVEHERMLGRLQVVEDLAPLWRQMAVNVLLVFLTALAAIVIVWIGSRRLRDGLIEPVDELARAVGRVAETTDYSVRARKTSDDELGELADAFNEMLARIETQATEVRNAREEAELASRMKDEFLATLSHELRTPMTPILGWAQILKRVGGDDPKTAQAADVIERNARVQMRIVDDLLDMSRIVSGKVSLELRSVDFAEVVEAAISTVRSAADARGIAVTTAIEPGLPPVLGDPNRLQQIVWNLVSNAIKFNREGGSVRVDLGRVGDLAVLRVADTGKGIAPEFLPHVFERFRQAESTSSRRYGGLGLGLAIVKQLVDLHGGSVRVASDGVDQGAAFTVELRFAPSEAAAIDAVARSEAPSLDSLRVLVVDDEPDARELVAAIAQAQGAEVVTAESADAALAILATYEADVLVSDIGMPVRDGHALIREVRRSDVARIRALPSVALTAFARASDRERAQEAGFDGHLAKPIDQHVLVETIARLGRRSIAPRPGAAEREPLR